MHGTWSLHGRIIRIARLKEDLQGVVVGNVGVFAVAAGEPAQRNFLDNDGRPGWLGRLGGTTLLALEFGF